MPTTAETGLLLQSKHLFEIQTVSGTPGTFTRIGQGINSFDPQFNENVLQDTYLTDEGFGTSTVAGAQLILSFNGHRKYGDAAQDFIFSKALELGKSRETVARWTMPNGKIWTGPCTIANIAGPGGDAGSKGEISFELHFNGKPVESTVA